MKIQYPVTAINRAGKTVLLNNQEELTSFCNSHKTGDEWSYWGQYYRFDRRIPIYHRDTFDPIVVDWILRDDFGNPVDPRVITKRHYPAWRKGCQESVITATEKGLPIPGCGKRKRRKGRWNSAQRLRFVDTAAENAAQNDFSI